MKKKTIKLILLLIIIVLILLFTTYHVHIATIGELSWPPFRQPGVPLMVTYGNVKDCCIEILYFRDKIGRYPKDLNELRDWIGITDSNDSRMRRYFDAWRRPLRYVVENPKLNVGKFDLYSVGKNGIDEYDKPDFGDDIHIGENCCIRMPQKNDEPAKCD
jgi:hypothetical protein